MSNNISKKHHFIPEFYIKGFANEDDNVYIYDVIHKKINKSHKKASQIFYKEHFHTVTTLGKKSVLIEDFYSALEGWFSQVIKKLDGCPITEISEVFKSEELCKIIVMMISIQYWRNPINTSYAKLCSNDLPKLYDKSVKFNGDVIPFDRSDVIYFYRKQHKEIFQKFIQFLILPLITLSFSPAQLKGLQIIKLNKGHKLICSDNPVMIDSLDSEFKFQGEFLYPLTKSFALTNIPFKSVEDINTHILEKASQKIVASSVDNLELLTNQQRQSAFRRHRLNHDYLSPMS